MGRRATTTACGTLDSVVPKWLPRSTRRHRFLRSRTFRAVCRLIFSPLQRFDGSAVAVTVRRSRRSLVLPQESCQKRCCAVVRLPLPCRRGPIVVVGRTLLSSQRQNVVSPCRQTHWSRPFRYIPLSATYRFGSSGSRIPCTNARVVAENFPTSVFRLLPAETALTGVSQFPPCPIALRSTFTISPDGTYQR